MRGVVTSTTKGALPLQLLHPTIATQVTSIGKLVGQTPKSIGAALMRTRPAMHLIARKVFRAGKLRGRNRSGRGVATSIAKGARPRQQLRYLMTVRQESRTGNLAFQRRRNNGAVLVNRSLAIRSIARKALQTGKLPGMRASVLGAVSITVRDAQPLVPQAVPTTAKLACPTGKWVGLKLKRRIAARVVVQRA